jgi:soluble lytic murein transglycosylase-like protein
MKPLLTLTSLALTIGLLCPGAAFAQRSQYESRYNAHLVGRGGTIGLMQIKLATARSLGYTGTAEGLRDPDTNLAYAVKYLAGAYRAAGGDHDRAVRYYAGGYYYAAKRRRAESRIPDAVRNDVMPR